MAASWMSKNDFMRSNAITNERTVTSIPSPGSMRCSTKAVGPSLLPYSRQRRPVLRAAGNVLDGTVVRSADHWKGLRDPAHIWASGDKSVRVRNYGEEVALAKYMILPVQQYYVLDPELITSLGRDSFEFSIPKMEVFNEWIQPTVVAKVKVSDTGVHIITKECSMNVSEMIASLNLDGQWYMIFESTLTWDDDCMEADKKLRGLDRMTIASNRVPGAKYGVMHGKSRVDVWCELAPGITFMPKDVLQNACNLAMYALMQSLLPVFMGQLSTDYKRWATDEAYREERKKWNIDRFKQKLV